MTREVSVDDAGAKLAELVSAAQQGDDIVILRGQQPVARLVPITQTRGPRRAGSAAGLVQMSDDFDAPLSDFDEYTR